VTTAPSILEAVLALAVAMLAGMYVAAVLDTVFARLTARAGGPPPPPPPPPCIPWPPSLCRFGRRPSSLCKVAQ
jgi:hypothetical protein